MTILTIFFLISAAYVHKAYGDVDSAGTDFLTIIPWNNNDVTTYPTVNLDFVNAFRTRPATVQLSYSVYSVTGEDIATSVRQATVTVGPTSSSRYTFSSDSIYQYVNHGLNTDYPSTKIYIHSDSPITVFAHNYAADGSGDTFTVLPTSMASKEYSFSLPAPATAQGTAMIYLLPTIADTNIQLTVITASSTKTYSVTALAGISAKVVMFGGPPKDFTFYASGDSPFVIVSAVRLLPTLTGSDIQDFGSFMPIPLTSKTCAEYSVSDYHITDLSSANYFTVTSPSKDCDNFQVTALGTTTNYTEALFISPGRVSSPTQFANRKYGDFLILGTQYARVEMVRYGGNGILAGQGKGVGAFLDNLPSRDQFVTGTTAYATYKGLDQLSVFGDEATRTSATNDGVAVSPVAWQTLLYYGNIINYGQFVVQNGTHIFAANGKYTLHISGTADNRAQGFTPRVMWQGTPSPSPTPETTSTSTTSTATPTTTATRVTPTPTTQPFGPVDSEGTEFLTIIPWNNNDLDSSPTVCLDFTNADKLLNATVDVIYSVYSIVGEDISISPRNYRVTIDPRSSKRLTLSTDSVYQYLSHGLNTYYPSTKISIYADNPISVFVHNYAADGSGDTFTVLPTTMASQKYSFSLPAPASASGIAMIYFLPTKVDTNIQFTVITSSDTRSYSASVPVSLMSPVTMFGGPPKDFTFYASGDAPFMIVAAVRHLPTLASAGVTDFGSFMPIPLTSQDCSESSVEDYHFTDLSSANYFTLTAPSPNCERFQVTSLGTTNYTEVIPLIPGRVHSPSEFTNTRYGPLLILRALDARVEAVRYGGFGKIAGQGKGEGAFLDNLPSRDQFISGTTPFVTFKGNDQITIFGDNATRNTATLDGRKMSFWQPVPYYGSIIYYAISTFEDGTHFFSADGKYTVHISGSTDNRAQGFTPRIMWRGNFTAPILPTTTAPTSLRPSEATTSTALTPIQTSTTTTTITTATLTGSTPIGTTTTTITTATLTGSTPIGTTTTTNITATSAGSTQTGTKTTATTTATPSGSTQTGITTPPPTSPSVTIPSNVTVITTIPTPISTSATSATSSSSSTASTAKLTTPTTATKTTTAPSTKPSTAAGAATLETSITLFAVTLLLTFFIGSS